MEGRVVLVGGGPVGRIDLQPPWEGRRTTEQLLVEVVADAADGLRHEQPRRGGVEEARDVGAASTQDPQAGERSARDAAPDPEAAFPDRERSPPVIGDL